MSIGFSSLISIGMLAGWFGRTGELNSKYRYPVMTNDDINNNLLVLPRKNILGKFHFTNDH